MYAVVESGGKQYNVAPGKRVRVDRIEGEKGSVVSLDRVLVLVDGENVEVGKPYVEGASVSATIVEEYRTRKVLVFRYAKRKRRRVKNGHREWFTALQIGEIRK